MENNIKQDKVKINKEANRKKGNSIFLIYSIIFLVLICALYVSWNSEKTQSVNNRKYILKSDKSEKNYSKKLENAEKHIDGESVSTKREVHESNNKEKNEKDKKDKDNTENNSKKKCYLTFDDGPSVNTSKILSVLKEHNAKATFFVVYHKGKNSEKLYKRIVDEGHTIAVHSYSHNYKKMYASKKAFKNDVVKMREYIKDVTGVNTNIYRFPGGSANKVSKVKIRVCIDVLKKESMLYFDWNVENGDATGKKISEKQMIENVVNNVKHMNTPIVLMHDTEKKDATVKTLPKIIKKLKKKGYEFVAINEETPRIQQIKE